METNSANFCPVLCFGAFNFWLLRRPCLPCRESSIVKTSTRALCFLKYSQFAGTIGSVRAPQTKLLSALLKQAHFFLPAFLTALQNVVLRRPSFSFLRQVETLTIFCSSFPETSRLLSQRTLAFIGRFAASPTHAPGHQLLLFL